MYYTHLRNKFKGYNQRDFCEKMLTSLLKLIEQKTVRQKKLFLLFPLRRLNRPQTFIKTLSTDLFTSLSLKYFQPRKKVKVSTTWMYGE